MTGVALPLTVLCIALLDDFYLAGVYKPHEFLPTAHNHCGSVLAEGQPVHDLENVFKMDPGRVDFRYSHDSGDSDYFCASLIVIGTCLPLSTIDSLCDERCRSGTYGIVVVPVKRELNDLTDLHFPDLFSRA